MKTANKKILIRISCILISVALVFSLLNIFVFDNGISVLRNKIKYNRTGEITYLYELCTDLILTSRYSDVIKYYPQLLSDDSFGELISGDSENDTYFDKGFSVEDVKSVYIVTYLNAHLEKHGEEKFKDEFDKYADMLSFHITEDKEVLTFSTLLLYSYKFKTLKLEWFNVEQTEIFLAALEEYVSDADLSNEQKEISSVYIREMRFLINTYDKDKIDALVVQYKDWDLKLGSLIEDVDNYHSLPNGFVLVEDQVNGGFYLGNKSWGNAVVIYVECNVTNCEYNEEYICVEQTLENGDKVYYIVDSVGHEVLGSYSSEEYNEKIQELSISELEQVTIDNQGTVL